MSAESRQVALQLALPALVLGVGYIWFGASAPQEELTRLRERLGKQSAAPGVSVGAQRRRMASVEEQLRAAQAERARVGELVAHLQGASSDDEERHACEEALIELFARRGVRLEGSGLVPAGFATPPSLEAARAAARAAAREVQASGEAPATSRRRRRVAPRALPVSASAPQVKPLLLRLRGNYLDVLAALEALGESELDLIPLALDLETRPVDGGLPRWSLVVQP